MGQWITDGKTRIGWDMFPDRKKPAICITECGNNAVSVYGYFKDEETAYAFMDRFAELVNAKPADNRCVCCGEIIPEGKQVCPMCEKKGYKDDN